MALPLSPETLFYSLSALQTLLSSNIYAHCGSARGLGKNHKPPSVILSFPLNIFIRFSRQEWHSKCITLFFSQAHGCQIQLAYYEGFPSWKYGMEYSSNIYALHFQSITLVQRGKLSVMLKRSTTLNSPDNGLKESGPLQVFKGPGSPKLPKRMLILSGVPSLWSFSEL